MKWPAFCAFMCGSAAAMPYSTPLMLTSIIWSHSSTLRRSSGECGIRPALLIITSMRPYASTARVDQRLDLLAVGHVGLHGERLAALGGQLGGQRLDAVGAPRAEHDRRALLGEMPRRRPRPGRCSRR